MAPCSTPINRLSLQAMPLLALLLFQSVLAQRTGEIQNPRLAESSGVAASRAHPGVLWTHNDSGDRPYLYATDLRGTDRGAVLVPGARAFDWEDLALGPCPTRTGTCVFIGDVGDNLEVRPFVTVYAVPEPDPPVSRADTLRTTRAPAVLRLRYPDGAHDVEALYVSPKDGGLFLVSKGRSGPIRLYRVDRGQWRGDSIVTAARVEDLPIRPRPREGRWITGAAMRPDGRLVALRTETEIYFFTPGPNGRLSPADRPVCRIRNSDYQGEAVDFLDDSTLVLTSEAAGRRRPGTIHVLRCPAGPGSTN
ncbi:MAG TPA: hypothetical protein VNL18_14245 [Gemmatimonadales bacterium]|nr:hypothetical protein [Gemmatimonadales bacterium]